MIQYVKKPAINTLQVLVKADKQSAFAEWQGQFNAEIVAEPGFVSLEFISQITPNQGWLIVQRFTSLQESNAWTESEKYKKFLSALRELTVNHRVEEVVTDETKLNGITEVIVAEVNLGKEQAYRDWIAKIHLLEAKATGFRGVYVQSPNENKGKFWITLLQFDKIENLDKWLASPDRQSLLEESKSLISYIETHRVISPYAGWFASIAKMGELPSVWKQTMLVLLVLFPIVMLEFKYLLPYLSTLNVSLSTFIGNAISVSLISFPLMPIAIYFLGWWLAPKSTKPWITLAGLVLMLILFLIEVWFFWSYV